MKALLQALRKEYDFVIIDLPPVLSVADAAIVAPNLDGFVFVVCHNTTDVRAIRDALGQLKMAGSRIIGFLYNDAAGGEGSYYSHSYR
jgi:Mrp family chromosome partitioning ATPase